LIDDLGKYLFRGSAIGYVVNPNIHLPIFPRRQLASALEERRSEYDEAVDSYNETLLEAAQQVADSLANLKQTPRPGPTPRDAWSTPSARSSDSPFALAQRFARQARAAGREPCSA